MSDASTVLASSTLNSRSGSQCVANVEPAPLVLFEPATGTVFACPIEEVCALRAEAAWLRELKEKLSEARAATGPALETLSVASDPKQLAAAERAVAEAAKAEQEARDKLFKELQELAAFNKGGKMMELLVLPSGAKGKNGANLLGGTTLVYVRSDKVKSHLRNLGRLNKSEQPELKSFYKPNAQTGKYELDAKALKDAFSLTAKKC